MTNPTEDAISAATHAKAMEAGFQAVRDMPDVPEAANDALTVEEHLRSELQAANDKIDVLTGRKGTTVTAAMKLVDGLVELEKKVRALEEANRALVEAAELALQVIRYGATENTEMVAADRLQAALKVQP